MNEEIAKFKSLIYYRYCNQENAMAIQSVNEDEEFSEWMKCKSLLMEAVLQIGNWCSEERARG